MHELIIGFIEDEQAGENLYLFDLFSQGLSDEGNGNSNDHYLVFTVIDKSNFLRRCYIPQKIVEKRLGKPIGDLSRFSFESAGNTLVIEEKVEVTPEENLSFLEGKAMYSVMDHPPRPVIIELISIEHKNKDPRGISVYNRYNQLKKLDFKKSKGNFNYIDGGYDLNAAFGGEAEAYWNID